MDTIFALATARGRAGVAVIRVSGPDAFGATSKLVGALPQTHRAGLRQIRDLDGALIDEALVICFSGGKSFTGEQVVELQTHGSPAVVTKVLQLLSEQSGLRLAEAGEFTRRALENDRLDLTQIEGLGDLIEAETEAQRRQAVRIMSGELSQKAGNWRADAIRAMALIEATIDFADEDVPVNVYPEVVDLLAGVASSLGRELDGVQWAERVRDGFQVAIIGAPNVGKSTLLNHLAGREVAITSEFAGTTRDVIEVRLNLKGIPVDVLDTAGVRASDDVVENIGVSRALSAAQGADLRVVLAADGHAPDGVELSGDDLVLRPKADALTPGGISGKTGAGVPELLDHIASVFERHTLGVGSAIKLRHQVGIQHARDNILKALGYINSGTFEAELVSDDIRNAVVAIESLVGKVDVEHILDEIFSSFCIGK